MLSCIRLFVTPWTGACQAALSMEVSRQEYWSRFPVATPGDLPDSGIEPESLESPALAGRVFTAELSTPVPPSSLCDRCQAGGLPLSGL